MRRDLLVLLLVFWGCDAGPGSALTVPGAAYRAAPDAATSVVYVAEGEGDCTITYTLPSGDRRRARRARLHHVFVGAGEYNPAIVSLFARCAPPSRMRLTLTVDGERRYAGGWSADEAERIGRYGTGGVVVISKTSH